MSTPLPPIYRDCRCLLVHTEDMLRRFSCYPNYTVGTDLRQSAMAIMRTVNQAVHDKPRQALHVRGKGVAARTSTKLAGCTPGMRRRESTCFHVLTEITR